MEFSISPYPGWMDCSKFLNSAEKYGLLPHQLLLLISDGSLTQHLEALYSNHIDVELAESTSAPPDKEACRALEIESGQRVLVRRVWLKVGVKRLVYAQSFIPYLYLGERLLNEITRSRIPLGRFFSKDYPFSSKGEIAIGIVKIPFLLDAFEVKSDTSLWARRYIYSVQSASGGTIIKTLITEVFSPEVMSCPAFE